MQRSFDVLILGAGPAGCTIAHCLGNSGLKVALIDKAVFPREKVCGDGLTIDVLNQLEKISGKLASAFRAFEPKLPSCGASIFSPGMRRLNLPVASIEKSGPMYTCRRRDFDNFMFNELRQYRNVSIYEDCHPQTIALKKDAIELETQKGIFSGRILIGADGVNSFIGRRMAEERISREEQCVSIRSYYRGLAPLDHGNPIEMYFLKDILPGYLWIFHLPGGISNVGIGLPASIINRRKISLKDLFEKLTGSGPLGERFATAERIEPVKGHIIPLGGKRKKISGDRFLLAGDAACLVDPFTGEGVGNAIRSGRVAADHIIKCFTADDFSAEFNKAYDKEIYRRMMPEFRFHSWLLKIFGHPRIVDFLINTPASHRKLEVSLQKELNRLSSGKPFRIHLFILNVLGIYTMRKWWGMVFKH